MYESQTALSGDLDVLKRTIANDIRPKQAQAEAEIAKQVEVLSRTKNELAGVKSAQATYEETTTRRLSELTNLSNGKASKSELTQTAEELASRIASVQAGSSRNYFRNSRSRTFTTGGQAVYDYRTFIVPDFWKNSDRFKRDYVRISFDVTFPVALVNDMPAMVHFSAHPWYAYRNLIFKGGTVERQHFEFTIDLSSSSEDYQTNNVFIRFGTNYGFPAGLQVVIENAMLSVGNYFPAYQPAYEDQEDRVSVVESNFKQRADSLEAGVSRLTEGLRTKAVGSGSRTLKVACRRGRPYVCMNGTQGMDLLLYAVATKDKASKSELTQTAEELSSKIASVQVGGINLLRNTASLLIGDRSKGCWMSASGGNGRAISVEVLDPPKNDKNMIRVIENTNGGNKDLTQLVRLRIGEKYTISCYARIASDSPNANVNLLFRSWANNTDLNRKFQKSISHKNWQKYSFTFTADAIENSIQFGQSGAGIIEICAPKIESGTLATDYSETPWTEPPGRRQFALSMPLVSFLKKPRR